MGIPEAFYSSAPAINVDGENREDLSDAIGSMVVNLGLSGCAHAELQVNNWGLSKDAQEPDFLFSDILPGAAIEIHIGQPEPELIFSGEITAIEEEYGQGAPQLTLLLQDKLHHLARHRRSQAWEDQSPNDILQTIASDAGLQSDIQVSAITDTWHQINESDLAFILRLCQRFDISPRLDGSSLRARPEVEDNSPVALDVQDNILQLRLLADLNHQITQSRTQGYNLATAEEVNFDGDSMTPAPGETSAAESLNQLSWDGEEILPHPFARSQAEAEAYAKAHFQRQAKRFISGDIACQGIPELTSGREIELSGVSSRLLGKYQVIHCTHRFDRRSGFETHLKVNKADWSTQ
ncbi:MAG: contractile injection system protein, VgrG/Pvc8 family [Pseudomonadota bacterium]|nr:contractile injection system protein, VgrG/Pvc8 family [Pseudomonadota bacterium]